MPYPPLSFSSPPPPGGPSGLRAWQTWHFQWPPRARTLASSSQAPKSCFFMRAWSSCRTSLTCASNFSRSMRSKAALFSASDSACLRVATSVVAPAISSTILSFFAIASFYIFFYKMSLSFFLLELPLGKTELLLGPLETLLQGAYLRSQCGGRKQRSLHTHIDSFFRLLRNLLDPLFGFSFRTPNRASGATVYAVIFLHIFYLPRSLLEGWHKLQSVRSWRTEPSGSLYS